MALAVNTEWTIQKQSFPPPVRHINTPSSLPNKGTNMAFAKSAVPIILCGAKVALGLESANFLRPEFEGT